jgi:hypothetical protein
MSETAKQLLEKMTDQVDHAVELVKVARMAAGSASGNDDDDDALANFGGPIAALLDVIADELRVVRDDMADDLSKEIANG